ncbi:MAG: superoxide dismutase [Phycisphaerae bacterium]
MQRLLEPREFANLASVAGLSRTTLDEHHQLYSGYVRKVNTLSEQLIGIQNAPKLAHTVDIANIKGDLCFALAAVRNHEMYFEILGDHRTEPPQVLQDRIAPCFGSMENFIEDLRHTALGTHGWAWTVLDHRTGRLWNVSGQHNGLFPFWDAQPILALDLCDHAYFYDFGHHRNEYINSLIEHLNWEKPAEYLTGGRICAQAGTPLVMAT